MSLTIKISVCLSVCSSVLSSGSSVDKCFINTGIGIRIGVSSKYCTSLVELLVSVVRASDW